MHKYWKSNNTAANINAYAISVTCADEHNRDIVKQSLQLLNEHSKLNDTITTNSFYGLYSPSSLHTLCLRNGPLTHFQTTLWNMDRY